MNTLFAMIRRNVRLFFRDKGMFFTSLITPVILLVLYGAFLKDVYRDSFLMALPSLTEELLNGLVGGQLISSILAVSCVTVSFCSNFLLVQDKANGTIKDLRIAPIKPWVLSLGYYAATLLSTLLICFVAAVVCLVYVAAIGWYMTALDVVLLLLDVVILVLFGTALSSVINFFLSSQGQISAVGTIVSSGYGFISGAYMPISSFGEGLQKAIMFLPGTYGTSLMRNHAMGGVIRELEGLHVPKEAISGLKDAMDCNLYFFENQVTLPVMYMVIGFTTLALIGIYILLNTLKKR